MQTQTIKSGFTKNDSTKRANRKVNGIESITNRDAIEEVFPEGYIFDLTQVFSVMPYTLEKVLSPTREKDILHYRQIITVYHFMSGLSLIETAQEVNRDHAKVLHSIRCVVFAMQGFDNRLKDKLDLVIQETEAGVMATRDTSMNELISLAYIESLLLKKFPNLAILNCFAAFLFW